MCFPLSSGQIRYSLLLKKMRGGEKVGTDEYLVTTTLAFDLLINKERGIMEKQQSSTYEIVGVEEDARKKSAWDTPLLKKRRNVRQLNFVPW